MTTTARRRVARSNKKKGRQQGSRKDKKPNFPPRSTEPLTANELAELTTAMIAKYGWTDEQSIRPFQLAGIQAQLEGSDMILQAPTGSGKTVIAAGPHSSPRSEGMITLISVPLVQLADDMVSGSTACTVNLYDLNRTSYSGCHLP